MGLFNINTISSKAPPIEVSLTVNGEPIKMTVDTGAAVSIISEKVIKTIKEVELKPTDAVLTTYTAERIKVLGCADMDVQYGSQRKKLRVYVVQGNRSCLLGRDWLKAIKLDWYNIATIQREREDKVNQLHQSYQMVFDGQLGTITGYQASLQVKEGAQPRFIRARPVPFALKAAVEQELERLEKEGILEKVSNSEWATPIVVVPKRGGCLRLCGDYKLTINPILETEVHPLPKPDEIFALLAGGQKFTKLDLANAYQQMVLNKESREILTINTHKGLYWYTRLPFGVSSAPAIFQRTMDTILAGTPHVACYIDDIIVTGTDVADHLRNLGSVLDSLQKHGIKAKESMCTLMGESIQYLGYVVDRAGIHSLPDRVKAIVDAPLPQNMQELRSFLGLINYYRRFIPHLSTILAHQMSC